jgi:hypothetical protein
MTPEEIPDASTLKFIDLHEFQDQGYLLEVNRQFFHPLGLALTLRFNLDTGAADIMGIQDWRDDPEGGLFTEITPEEGVKAKEIERQWQEKAAVRQERYGFVVQPLPKVEG